MIDGEISDKSMDYSDLADTCVSGSYGGDGISNIDIRQALVSEYIISRYAGYTDYIEKTDNKLVILKRTTVLLAGCLIMKSNIFCVEGSQIRII